MRLSSRSALLLPLCLLPVFAADDAPEWARQAAAQTVPSYPAKVASVVLVQEEAVTVDPDGRRVMRERGAVKVLQRGSNTVHAFRTYNTKNGRIRDFQGWLIPPSGKATSFAKNRILDVSLSREYAYEEARAKVLDSGVVEPGTIFAWEIVEEEKTIFTQFGYQFQGEMPVLISRFSLNLPAGWEARGVIFNKDGIEPQVAGTNYTWEMRNLPALDREDYSPSFSAMAPRLAVSTYPPTDNRGGLQGLKDWAAVSTWLSPFVEPSAQVTDAIRVKAQQLTASASTELDKIRAIAAFAQQTSYVAIDLNVTRGGGYTPKRAEDTLTKNYGDCKDKATLMRSLLKAIGIESYLVPISADDRTFVRPEWASPFQFNHAIIAVRVSEGIDLPTVIKDSPAGRLLIFDPTDPVTQVGDLPEEEQGSWALVVAGSNGALLKMPLLPTDAHRIESSVDGAMDADGKLDARFERDYFGQAGSSLRYIQKAGGPEELKKRFERGFARRLGGITLTNFATDSRGQENRVRMNAAVAAEHFGQIMQGRMLIVRPGILSSGGDYNFTSRQRTAPIKLESDLRRDSIKLKLPAGFRLDELPAPAKLESPYGSLSASWVVQNGEIVMNQTLEIRDTVAPASDYPKIRDFFDRVAGAQAAPVVLLRQ